MGKFKTLRGFKDLLPEEAAARRQAEDRLRRAAESFGYREISPPLLEETGLFSRSIGETTDIVEKEMYTFEDWDGKKVTLRPEGTAPIVRAYLEHHLSAPQGLTKLYYFGPMFRHERPQAGRLRQFHQFGVEAIGSPDPAIDVEILALLIAVLEDAGLSSGDFTLEINSLGCLQCRPPYRERLSKALASRLDTLCEDCKRRAGENPLRVFDCKRDAQKIADLPAPIDSLCPACAQHFKTVREGLNRIDLKYRVNSRLVRGLDYYTRTAFEVVASRLGAQNAVAAGGRYDGLVEMLGGPPTPAIGFALGLERLVSLLPIQPSPPTTDLFLAVLGEEATLRALPLLFAFRRSGVRCEIALSGKSLKSQLRSAESLSAKFTVIIGESELSRGKAIVKKMEDGTQQEVPIDSIVPQIKSLI